jgi:hypothetical protein
MEIAIVIKNFEIDGNIFKPGVVFEKFNDFFYIYKTENSKVTLYGYFVTEQCIESNPEYFSKVNKSDTIFNDLQNIKSKDDINKLKDELIGAKIEIGKRNVILNKIPGFYDYQDGFENAEKWIEFAKESIKIFESLESTIDTAIKTQLTSDKKQPIYIRVISCSDPETWYYNKIGNCMRVYESKEYKDLCYSVNKTKNIFIRNTEHITKNEYIAFLKKRLKKVKELMDNTIEKYF